MFFGVIPNLCSLFGSEHMVGLHFFELLLSWAFSSAFRTSRLADTIADNGMLKERGPWGFGKDLLELLAKK